MEGSGVGVAVDVEEDEDGGGVGKVVEFAASAWVLLAVAWSVEADVVDVDELDAGVVGGERVGARLVLEGGELVGSSSSNILL